MPKPPNPESKGTKVTLSSKPEWVAEIRAFKEICARNGLSMSLELYKRGVRSFLRDHNWPPGNSQTSLSVFGVVTKTKCGLCNKLVGKVQRVEYASGSIIPSCDSCLNKNRKRGLVKKVWGTL